MRRSILCALLLVPACFDGGSSDDGSEFFGGPRSGMWAYSEGQPYDDTCMWEGRPDSSGEMTVTNGEDGTFTVVPMSEAEPFECSLDGYDFVCDEIADFWQVPLLDARFDYTVNYSGTFEHRERAAGDYVFDVDCTGMACDLAIGPNGVAELPCHLTVPVTAAFLE
jgi:hypothetical protein